jgi:AcrR family transcriptional regulator
MPKTGKSKRPYNSTRRQLQAQETRRLIIEAARRLFDEYGYAGATIDAIAQEAGVAAETIFATFGNKRTILAQLIALAVGGDEQAVPLLDRPGPQTVLQERDPVRQLQLFAEGISTILERVAPIFTIMRVAAKTELDIAEMLKNMLEERWRTLGAMVQSLAAHGPLRTGLDAAQGADIVWTLTSPEVFTLLTVDRGWPRARYVAWLSDALIRLLLP